jgi:hypothetical protein
VRVGALDVSILVDGEGSFAIVAEAFPTLSSPERWRLPVNSILCSATSGSTRYSSPIRSSSTSATRMPTWRAATRERVLGELADRGMAVVVSHFHGPGRFGRSGEGFSWSSLAKEGEAAVE